MRKNALQPNFPKNKRLWLANSLPVVAWFMQLFGGYVFAEWACLNQRDGGLINGLSVFIGIGFLSSLACLFGLVLAYRSYTKFEQNKTKLGEFFAVTAAALNSYLLIVILMQSVPALLVPLC